MPHFTERWRTGHVFAAKASMRSAMPRCGSGKLAIVEHGLVTFRGILGAGLAVHGLLQLRGGLVPLVRDDDAEAVF